jgi:hypothetical protein
MGKPAGWTRGPPRLELTVAALQGASAVSLLLAALLSCGVFLAGIAGWITPAAGLYVLGCGAAAVVVFGVSAWGWCALRGYHQ